MRTKGLNEENSTIENLAATAKPSFQSQKLLKTIKSITFKKIISNRRKVFDTIFLDFELRKTKISTEGEVYSESGQTSKIEYFVK